MDLDGKKLSQKITIKLKKEVASFSLPPKMIIIQVGNNSASNKYVDFKLKKAQAIGITAKILKFDEKITQSKLEDLIKQHLDDCDGMIVQLPLPSHIDKHQILDKIPFDKDIDGLASGNDIVVPATPRGIIDLMVQNGVKIANQKIAVVGKSSLVGNPVANLCKKLGGNVSQYSERTGLKGTEEADVLIVASGVPKLIKAINVKKNAIIIDVGINEIADKNAMKKIVGDVDRESIGSKAKAISPVPGGVGPMTVVSLMTNLIEVYNKKLQEKNK